MELQHLRYFIDIAENESITKAAEINHMVQPAMSRILSLLEKEFGTKLFNRVGRNIYLNGSGKILLDESKKALSILDNIQEQINHYNGQMTGKISLCMEAPVREFSAICKAFRKKYPLITLDIYKPRFDEPTSLTADYDLYIYLGAKKFKADYNTRIIASEDIIAMFHEDNPLASKPYVDLENLAAYEFYFPQIPQFTEIFTTYCYQKGFIPQKGGVANHPMGQLLLLETNPEKGVVVAPKGLTTPCEHCKILPIRNPSCTFDINLAWNQHLENRPSVEIFRQHIIDHIIPFSQKNL